MTGKKEDVRKFNLLRKSNFLQEVSGQAQAAGIFASAKSYRLQRVSIVHQIADIKEKITPYLGTKSA